MFKPVPMAKVNVLILGKYVPAVTEALGKAGVVHLVNAVEQSRKHLLHPVNRDEAITYVERLLERCVALLEALAVDDDPDFDVEEEATPQAESRIEALLADIEKRHTGIQRQLEEHLRDAGLLHRTSETLRAFPVQHVRMDALRHLGHLYMVAGQVSRDRLPETMEAVGERGLLVVGNEAGGANETVLVLTARRNRWGIESELEKLGFVRKDPPADVDDAPAAASRRMEDRLVRLRAEIDACRLSVMRLGMEFGGPLLASRRHLSGRLAMLKAQRQFGQRAHLFCISGWVPRENAAFVRAVVDEATAGTGVVEWVDPEVDERVREGEEDVPVMFERSRWLRPFRLLITNFGVPRYNEIDPSLFVAISFVLMFGVMFGDVGQGAVIALSGWWLQRSRHPRAAAFRDGGMLLVFCGLSACVFGFLYGSVFGYEEFPFLRPLWLHPLHDVTRLLVTSVGLGVVCISIAILINIVNKLRTRRWFEGIFDRFGVLGIIFYWGSIGLGIRAAKAGDISPLVVGLVVFLPLALLFIREPLHNLVRRRNALPGDVITFFLEACIETMETVTAFLGNTVSFVRVGAFALSHAALCLAIYSIIDILHGLPWGTLWSFLVLVCGNLLVIFLEGMVAFIQGVRLEYYELFGKYFSGDGVMYRPFALPRIRDARENDLVGIVEVK